MKIPGPTSEAETSPWTTEIENDCIRMVKEQPHSDHIASSPVQQRMTPRGLPLGKWFL